MGDNIYEGEVFEASCCYSDAYVVSDLHRSAAQNRDKGLEDTYESLVLEGGESETYTNLQVDKVDKGNCYQTVTKRAGPNNELCRHSLFKEEPQRPRLKDTLASSRSTSESGEIKIRKRRLALIIIGIVTLQIVTVTMAVILPVSLFTAMRGNCECNPAGSQLSPPAVTLSLFSALSDSCETSIETSCNITMFSEGSRNDGVFVPNCTTQNIIATSSDTVPINAQCIQVMEDVGADPSRYHVATTLEVLIESNQMRCLCSLVSSFGVFDGSGDNTSSNVTVATNESIVQCGLQVTRCS